MREIKDTVHSLRVEVQAELDSRLKELELQPMMENQTSSTMNIGKADNSTRV